MLSDGSPGGTEQDGSVNVVLIGALRTEADGTRGRCQRGSIDQFSPSMSLFGPKNVSVKGEGFRCEARRDWRAE